MNQLNRLRGRVMLLAESRRMPKLRIFGCATITTAVAVGTQLMAHSSRKKPRHKAVKRLVADIQNDNPAVWAVLSKLPYPIHRSPEGAESSIEIELIGNEQRA